MSVSPVFVSITYSKACNALAVHCRLPVCTKMVNGDQLIMMYYYYRYTWGSRLPNAQQEGKKMLKSITVPAHDYAPENEIAFELLEKPDTSSDSEPDSSSESTADSPAKAAASATAAASGSKITVMQ